MTISEATKFIEKAFNTFNKKYFEGALPQVAITIQASPKAYGHFTVNKVWEISEEHTHEINIGAENLNRPIEETIGTLIHEMVHLYCHENNIQDTSRRGQYHNKTFKAEAEKRGLIISYDKRIGWSITTPTEQLKEYCKRVFKIQRLEIVRQGIFGADTNKTKSKSYKYTCPNCDCSFKSTKDLHLICGVCFEDNEDINFMTKEVIQ
ncbi:MAG: SprT family zinc-dependent metalloprotease [Ruminococcaceae bacterium]|nr:SprT family zinc-dependent metalloprotease [Oscillospiraceae bacterium]